MRSVFTIRVNHVEAKTPDNAPTIPAMVGIVAFDTPAAIERAFPEPDIAITSKTSIIPVTVPINPNNGHKATKAWITGILPLRFKIKREMAFWRICSAFHDDLSSRACHPSKTLRLLSLCDTNTYNTRSRMSIHITKIKNPMTKSTWPPVSVKSRMASKNSIMI